MTAVPLLTPTGHDARSHVGVPGVGSGALNKFDATTAPAVTDDSGDGYSVGSVWIDVTANASYICVDAAVGAAIWNAILVTATGANLTGTYDIEGNGAPTYTDAGMSDEFGAGTLDAQWTPVGAGAGSVALLTANPAASVYDLTTRAGDLLVQVDISGSVAFRQDALPANGEQIIVAMSVPSPGDSVVVNNSMWCGIGVNDTDTDYDAGTARAMFWDGADSARLLNVVVPGGTTALGDAVATPGGRRSYWRLAQSAGVLHFFWSLEGSIWTPMGSVAVGAFNNFWIFMDSKAVAYDAAPIGAIHWVRHVANTNHDPW
jgi:hypothetical protein